MGVYAIFGNAPLAVAEGRCVTCEVLTTTIGQRASKVQGLDRPIEKALELVKFGEIGGK